MAPDDLDDDLDGDEGEGPVSVPAQRGGGSKRIIFMVVLPLLLVIGAIAGAYFTGAAQPLIDMIFGSAQREEPKKEAPREMAVFYDLPEMLVNINSAGRKTNYLKIRVALELPNPGDVPRVEAMMPRIIDNFQVYLRELRMEDLKGSAGMYRLREELLTRVNAAAAPAKVNDVLFKEMLVQ